MSGGFFLGALALIFITLKLIGIITWSWALVLAPLYAILLIFGFFLFVFAEWVLLDLWFACRKKK